jgi:hypothetical protein
LLISTPKSILPLYSSTREKERHALAVIIPGSESRPHFAGLSYVRSGSESVEASEQQFMEFIAQRNSKAARILLWKHRKVTVINRPQVCVESGQTTLPWPAISST